jgi:indolepyruvate ferredoxin oxidoreductase beta subunit
VSENIVLCGVGGQGTVLASKLIASAAMGRGLPVKTAETIGMAQRGGSVFSHVRIGADAASPFVARGTADLVIAFEPAEALRQLPFLRPGGAMVVSSRPVVPVSATIGGPAYDLEAIMSYLAAHVRRLTVVDADAAAADLGTARVLNVVLLSAAVSAGATGLTMDDLRAAVGERVPERFRELNGRALGWAAAHCAGPAAADAAHDTDTTRG